MVCDDILYMVYSSVGSALSTTSTFPSILYVLCRDQVDVGVCEDLLLLCTLWPNGLVSHSYYRYMNVHGSSEMCGRCVHGDSTGEVHLTFRALDFGLVASPFLSLGVSHH